MADPRFFTRAGPFRLEELALIGKADIAPGGDPARSIGDVAPLDAADADHVSFLDNRKYVDAFAASRAGACVVHPALADRAPAGMSLLLSQHPHRAYARIAQAFYPRAAAEPGVAPSAIVDPTARVDATAEIGPGVVIGARAEIGVRCRVAPNAVIGAGVTIGEDTTVGANASLTHCLIGSRVVIYAGVRIGQDGFGFAIDPAGHIKVPQLGRVVVHDDVEIGANTTIDRGAGPDTVIGRGCMIDNLVQIGHNVEIGQGSVIVAQAGVAGSSKLAEFVVLAAQAGVAGHLKVGAGARVAAKSGIMRDVAPGEEVAGAPAMPIRQFWRLQAKLSKLMNEDNKGR